VGENTHIGSDAPILAIVEAPTFLWGYQTQASEGKKLTPLVSTAGRVGTSPALSPVSSGHSKTRVGESTQVGFQQQRYHTPERTMTWTKPEAEVVAVTMEVTAYVATL
jgi:hypothetical protein